MCSVSRVDTAKRGRNEAAKVYIMVHEGQLPNKCGGGGVVITAVFLAARLYSAFLGTWQIHWQSK